MASSGYSVVNSLSPMMFRKNKKKQEGGTRNERMRSKSVENILDTIPPKHKQKRSGSTPFAARQPGPPWKEVSLVKSTSPPITCILPASSMDFVASALLAVGAVPLITEDPADIPNDLCNSKAVVVDISAPQKLIESFIDKFSVGSCPLVLVTSQSGTNDRKKELAVRVVEESGPTLITGRLGDVYAVAQAVEEKTCSPLESLSSSDDEEIQRVTNSSPPKVVLNSEEVENHHEAHVDSLPPVLRRARLKKASSSSPSISPKVASPEVSPFTSPRTTPRGSPVNSPRGVRKFIKRGKTTGQAFGRVPTCLPRVQMKGQFRETQMCDVSVTDALEQAQKLAAHTKAFINLHETNVVTNGEVVVEISNNQLGMGNLPSTLQVCGSIAAAVLACAKGEPGEEDEIQLKHCSHALALYYVAGEEGAASASTTGKGLIAPGTLRQLFVDALNYLDERTVQEKAEMFAYSEGMKKQHYH